MAETEKTGAQPREAADARSPETPEGSAEAAEHAARLRAEAAAREARREEELAAARERAEATRRAGSPGIARVQFAVRRFGEPIEVRIATASGEYIDVRTAVPGGENVKLVVGPKLEVDPISRAVTVPVDFNYTEIPFLVREIARVANSSTETVEEEDPATGKKATRPRYPHAAAINKELTSRTKLEQGLDGLQEDYRWFRFHELRERYRRLEEAHSETVKQAEKGLDLVMASAAVTYKEVTGRDLYEDRGGESIAKDEMRTKLLEEQNDLVFKYDKNGNRYFFGTPEEGAEDLRDISFFDRLGRVIDDSRTMQDYRIRNKILEHEDRQKQMESHVQSFVKRATGRPVTFGYSVGRKAAIIVGAITLLVIDQPVKLFNWGLDKVDGVLYDIQSAIGKWWKGKDYKPDLKKSADRREEHRAAVDKLTQSKLSGK